MTSQSVAIVTGAGGGIGQHVASTLAENHWSIVVNDIDQQAADATTKAMNLQGQQAHAFGGDVSDAATVKTLFAFINETYQRPATLLVNNAAVQTWATLQTLTLEDWQRTLDTNLTGCFLMSKAFAEHAPRDSAIINLGSGCNQLAFPKLIDYAASKGGIEMFTKSTALDLGPHGIRVNCIAPGAIATDRTASETADYSESWAELTPLGRIGTPQDVANAVLLLTDSKAAYITGQTLQVDGGLFSRAIWPVNY